MRIIQSAFATLVFFAMLPSAFIFMSCSTVEDGSYVAPISLYEKIGGKWVLNAIEQTDETTSQKMALTNVLDFDTFVINLHTDEANNPTTFSVEGTAPALLPLNGTWQLDNAYTKSDATASNILLKGETGEMKLTVTGVPGNDAILAFRLTRKANGKAFVSYTYNLMSAVK